MDDEERAYTEYERQTSEVIDPTNHLPLTLPLTFRLVRQILEDESESEDEKR